MNAVPAAQMPTIPAAASRPAKWPGATPAKGRRIARSMALPPRSSGWWATR